MIQLLDDKNKGHKSGKFESELFIKTVNNKEGEKGKVRFSLRYGIKEFYEGITLSYAKTFDKSNNYAPFKPFAYLTYKKEERPFILYYEPNIQGLESRGPIIVHGGLTSAFYEFTEESTGKLISSTACWLVNQEKDIKKRNLIDKVSEYKGNDKFTGWISHLISVFTILILDVSGSMTGHYSELVDLVNEIINDQKDNEENEGVIILFGTNAKKVKWGKYKDLFNNKKFLTEEEIKNAGCGGGTEFKEGFHLANEYIDTEMNKEKEFIMKRVIFLTDGQGDAQSIIHECKKMKQQNFLIYFIGFDVDINNLKVVPHDYLTRKNTFKEIKKYIMKQFAALIY